MTDDQAARIHDRIDALAKDVSQINTNVEVIAASSQGDQSRLDRISTMVRGGNGKGLLSRVDLLEQLAEQGSKTHALLSGTIAATIGAVVAGLVVAFAVN